MKGPKFTVRRLMVAVAVVAAIFGLGSWMGKWSARFLFISDSHFARMQILASEPSPSSRRKAAYHGQMAEKYRHAARRPWLPVAPDPPEPQ